MYSLGDSLPCGRGLSQSTTKASFSESSLVIMLVAPGTYVSLALVPANCEVLDVSEAATSMESSSRAEVPANVSSFMRFAEGEHCHKSSLVFVLGPNVELGVAGMVMPPLVLVAEEAAEALATAVACKNLKRKTQNEKR